MCFLIQYTIYAVNNLTGNKFNTEKVMNLRNHLLMCIACAYAVLSITAYAANYPKFNISHDGLIRQSQPYFREGLVIFNDWTGKADAMSYGADSFPNLRYFDMSTWSTGMITHYTENKNGLASDNISPPLHGHPADYKDGQVLYTRLEQDPITYVYTYTVEECALTGGAVTVWFTTNNFMGYPVIRPQFASTGVVFESQSDGSDREIYWCSAPGAEPRNLSQNSTQDYYMEVYDRTAVWLNGPTVGALDNTIMACDVVTGTVWNVKNAPAGGRQDSVSVGEQGISWITEPVYSAVDSTNVVYLRPWGGTNEVKAHVGMRLKHGRLENETWVGIGGWYGGPDNKIMSVNMTNGKSRAIANMDSVYWADMVPTLGLDTNGLACIVADSEVYVLLEFDIVDGLDDGTVTNTFVTLRTFAPGVQYMKVANTTDNWESVAWQPITNTMPWTLSQDIHRGPSRVYVQYWYSNSFINRKTEIGWDEVIVKEPVPVIIPTNAPGVVDFGVTSWHLYGTNDNVYGDITVSNSFSSNVFTFTPIDNSFSLFFDGFEVGTNTIYMWATNWYGTYGGSTTDIIRLPEVLPYVEITNRTISAGITNKIIHVGELVNQAVIGGTNFFITGPLYWENMNGHGAGEIIPVSNAFETTITNLHYTDNIIKVWGTNIHGTIAEDIIIIDRENPTPYINITNGNFTVGFTTESAMIGGTNVNIVGNLQWAFFGKSGFKTIVPVSNSFVATINGLELGANRIIVTGTNEYGDIGFDMITITRYREKLSVIWPSSETVPRESVITAVGTVENAREMTWSNAWNNGVSQGMITPQPVWSASIQIGPGTNTLTVIGIIEDELSLTNQVTFIADLSTIDIVTPSYDFSTNINEILFEGTSVYLNSMIWWNTSSVTSYNNILPGYKVWSLLVHGDEGTNSFSIWGFSDMGNVSMDERMYIVDTQSPVIITMNPSNNYVSPFDDISISWQANEKVTARIYTNNALATVTSTTNYVMTYLNEGEYTWYVVARDHVGNVGYSSTSSFNITYHPTPRIDLSVSEIDFGPVMYDVSAQKVIQVYNTGSALLDITGTYVTNYSSIDRWLSLDYYSGTLPTGGMANVTLTADTTDMLEGMYTCDVVFVSNDPVSPKYTVPTFIEIVPEPSAVYIISLLCALYFIKRK